MSAPGWSWLELKAEGERIAAARRMQSRQDARRVIVWIALALAAGLALNLFAIVRAASAGSMREAFLAPPLIQLIAELRSAHGAQSVRVSAGRSFRYVRDGQGRALRLSCHAAGEAFDGYLSGAALAAVRAKKFYGVITYAGAMQHVHVSSCARERGVRAHMTVNARGWPVNGRGEKYARQN
jgi:hypothetical protein